MDYTDVLDDISYKLTQIIDILEGMNSNEITSMILILITVFLVLYIMRGE